MELRGRNADNRTISYGVIGSMPLNPFTLENSAANGCAWGAETPQFERDLFLGIDPGHLGGLAVLERVGLVLDASRMPETEKDLSDYVQEFGGRIRKAVIEAVHSMPGQGVSSSFKFGMSYGALRMVLIAHAVSFEAVPPQTWQKSMHCTVQGRTSVTDSKTAKKNGTKARAQELFPGQKVTHAIADALLLAE
jgi:hypothetical protein